MDSITITDKELITLSFHFSPDSGDGQGSPVLVIADEDGDPIASLLGHEAIAKLKEFLDTL